MEEITTLIPAREGSVRVPQKNLRAVGGKPLVVHAIEAGLGRIIVDTDDPQVKSIAKALGAEVNHRPPHLAGSDASIDDLLREVYLPHPKPLLVIQPTVVHPDLPDLVGKFVQDFLTRPDQTAWTMGTEDRHLVWADPHTPPSYRANSQELSPSYREIGCRVYAAGVSDPSPGYLWPANGILDIDTHTDLAGARLALEKGRVIFRVRANEQVGSGHLHRCRALAAELAHHRVGFCFMAEDIPRWALDMVEPWPILHYDITEAPDGFLKGAVVVNDTLDTTTTEMTAMKAAGAMVVGIEDAGPGGYYADLLINDLYPTGLHRNERSGPDWAVLRPEFAVTGHPRPANGPLLVTFGGTDPAQITERAVWELSHLSTKLQMRVVVPPGRPAAHNKSSHIQYLRNPSMAAEMAGAALVLTSGGRTVWEAAAMGTPIVTVLQNPREATHSHLRLSRGVVNLGPAHLLEQGTIRRTIEYLLLGDGTFLADMREALVGLVDGKGLMRVAAEIERMLRL